MFPTLKRRQAGRRAARRFRPALEALGQRVLPAVQTWTGLGATNQWTDPGNWAGHVTPSGGNLFFAGDDLYFPPNAPQKTNFNNFPDGTIFHTITVGDSGYHLEGHRVALLTPASDGTDLDAPYGEGSSQVDFDIDFGTPVPGFESPHEIGLGFGGNTLVLTGSLSGTPKVLRFEGNGELVLSGASTYAGPTEIHTGVVNIRSASALGATFHLFFNDHTVSAGGTLELQGGITTAEPLELDDNDNGITALRNVSGTNTVTGAVQIDQDTPLEVAAGSQLRISGVIADGNSILTSTRGFVHGGPDLGGTGTLVLSAANTYTGVTTIGDGQLVIENAAALGSTQAGTLVAGGALLARGNLTVAEPVTLGGEVFPSSARMGAGANSSVVWTGPIQLANDGTLDDTARGSRLVLTGGLTGTANLTVGSLSAAGTTSGSGGEVDFNGGVLTYSGTTTVNAGTLFVNVPVYNSPVTVTATGTLSGTSSLPKLNAMGGTVSPGSFGLFPFRQGTLSVGGAATFGPAATLHIDLSRDLLSLAPASTTLQVGGVVNLGGATLDIGLVFPSAVGDTFTVLDNRSGQDVVGTFANLPVDGSTFTVTDGNGNLERFAITYHGGRGHSVVLTHIDTATMARDLLVTPTAVRVGQPVTLSGRLVDPDPLDRLTLVVSWGDGTPAQTFYPGTAPFRLRHRYRQEGTYVIHVSWSDDHGEGNSRDLSVTVTRPGRGRGARDTFFGHRRAGPQTDLGPFRIWEDPTLSWPT
jgi:autotransporter-associated beta strand protein